MFLTDLLNFNKYAIIKLIWISHRYNQERRKWAFKRLFKVVFEKQIRRNNRKNL
jgi:hypothetical protein